MRDSQRTDIRPPGRDDTVCPSLPEVYASVHVPSGGR